MLSNCGHDENGGYSGGRAGDQTGTEWQLIPWYRYTGGWQYMLRHPDRQVGNLMADLAIEAANNNYIGYNQDKRLTFWQQLPTAGYRPKNISTPCDTDCSAGDTALVKCAGYLLGLPKLANISADCYTGNIRAALQGAGFEVYTDSKYLTSDKYLLPGDLLLKEFNHICMNVTYGDEAREDEDMWLDKIRDTVIGKTCVYYARSIVDDLKLRVYPEADAPTMKWDHFDKGNPVLVVALDKTEKWAKIVFNYGEYGSEGWVWKDYLERI